MTGLVAATGESEGIDSARSSVSGKVARFAVTGSLGRYSGPCCPQPSSPTAQAPRIMGVIKILVKLNIAKL